MILQKETALMLIDDAEKQESFKQQQKITYETAKAKHFKEKSDKKQADKDAKRTARTAKMEELYKAHVDSKKEPEPAPKAKRLVQFEDEEQVAPPTKKHKSK